VLRVCTQLAQAVPTFEVWHGYLESPQMWEVAEILEASLPALNSQGDCRSMFDQATYLGKFAVVEVAGDRYELRTRFERLHHLASDRRLNHACLSHGSNLIER